MSERKGVVLVRDENGKEKIYTKYIYLRMKRSGRKIELIKEAKNWNELKSFIADKISS